MNLENKIYLIIIGLIAALCVIIIVLIVIEGIRAAKIRNSFIELFYKEPIIYIMDKKQFNYEDAKNYYWLQVDKKNRKEFNLKIYDTARKVFIYDDCASKYFPNITDII